MVGRGNGVACETGGMFEPAHEDLADHLFNPEYVVWVKLQYRTKGGKPTHRFKYEKKRLQEIGAKYLREFQVWELPPAEESLKVLDWIWEQSTPVVYAKELWEEVSSADLH